MCPGGRDIDPQQEEGFKYELSLLAFDTRGKSRAVSLWYIGDGAKLTTDL
jgi:hypothetical protein